MLTHIVYGENLLPKLEIILEDRLHIGKKKRSLMPNILRPDQTSRANILLFLNTIADIELRDLLIANIDLIIAMGSESDQNRNHRSMIYQAIEQLIESKLEGEP
jgi:hypothetical protein